MSRIRPCRGLSWSARYSTRTGSRRTRTLGFVDIVEFLTERIREDEAAARKLLNDSSVSESGKWYEHRLLLECEVKKRLIGIVASARQSALASMVNDPDGDGHWIPQSIGWMAESLNALALPYHDHPDFEQDWLR